MHSAGAAHAQARPGLSAHMIVSVHPPESAIRSSLSCLGERVQDEADEHPGHTRRQITLEICLAWRVRCCHALQGSLNASLNRLDTRCSLCFVLHVKNTFPGAPSRNEHGMAENLALI